MRGSRKLCHRGLALTTFFLVDEGRRGDPYNTKSGPSSGNGAMIARQGMLAWKLCDLPGDLDQHY